MPCDFPGDVPVCARGWVWCTCLILGPRFQHPAPTMDSWWSCTAFSCTNICVIIYLLFFYQQHKINVTIHVFGYNLLRYLGSGRHAFSENTGVFFFQTRVTWFFLSLEMLNTTCVPVLGHGAICSLLSSKCWWLCEVICWTTVSRFQRLLNFIFPMNIFHSWLGVLVFFIKAKRKWQHKARLLHKPQYLMWVKKLITGKFLL